MDIKWYLIGLAIGLILGAVIGLILGAVIGWQMKEIDNETEE